MGAPLVLRQIDRAVDRRVVLIGHAERQSLDIRLRLGDH